MNTRADTPKPTFKPRRTAAKPCAEPSRRSAGATVLVNNAARQMTFQSLEDIPDEEWDRTFAVNISAMFHITKAAATHMPAATRREGHPRKCRRSRPGMDSADSLDDAAGEGRAFRRTGADLPNPGNLPASTSCSQAMKPATSPVRPSP